MAKRRRGIFPAYTSEAACSRELSASRLGTLMLSASFSMFRIELSLVRINLLSGLHAKQSCNLLTVVTGSKRARFLRTTLRGLELLVRRFPVLSDSASTTRAPVRVPHGRCITSFIVAAPNSHVRFQNGGNMDFASLVAGSRLYLVRLPHSLRPSCADWSFC